jgi:hypothetical protein
MAISLYIMLQAHDDSPLSSNMKIQQNLDQQKCIYNEVPFLWQLPAAVTSLTFLATIHLACWNFIIYISVERATPV